MKPAEILEALLIALATCATGLFLGALAGLWFLWLTI